MSTFKGVVAEFPQIRIDYFRQQPEFRPPLACFLSHVHSDHLVGLESMRAPFVYCSAATKEILLRLEKYHYRLNFAKGILESRNVTYDRSMRKLAKPLPLDTPTTLELAPGSSIRVTLIDANHCIGAVMFLIEGDGKAVLYTGDIRAETWWVNSLVQNPILLPYTLENRRLDCMYLDTTFATKSEPYKSFPSKAEGIRELFEKVSQYPDDTIFYFHSWTFGYENVWIALSALLKCQIHLDDYRARIYGSLSTLDKKQLREIGLRVQSDNKSLRESGLEVREAPALCGFRNGNHIQHGCLTSRENVRIHSCERGMGCRVMDQDAQAKIVHIIPIITCANGTEIAEIGAGGGKGDLDQKEELETGGIMELQKLMELCANTIQDEQLLSKVLGLLHQTLTKSNDNLDLDMQMRKANPDSEDGLSLQTLVTALSANASRSAATEKPQNRTIRFPYSRHSSYSELCELVSAFKPSDVFPCTVDEERWEPAISMQNLFGEHCSADKFRHDIEMRHLYEARLQRQRLAKRGREDTQESTQMTDDQLLQSPTAKRACDGEEHVLDLVKNVTPVEILHCAEIQPIASDEFVTADHFFSASSNSQSDVRPNDEVGSFRPVSASDSVFLPSPITVSDKQDSKERVDTVAPTSSTPSLLIPLSDDANLRKKEKRLTNRQLAYKAAIGVDLTWADFGGLSSTRSREEREEREL
ncbi:beta-lactamase-like protein [Ampelomyces quisqualis]|uniref:Protein artemis n=1 Tax=Ampelomyces quisqualis TaxID=50730 RepID=A0A6A5QH29_AMPQU|nr:beta-lactamase-like protein [Ampelomyces quisqualis]